MTQPKMMLLDQFGGLVFNSKRRDEVHLQQFQTALDSWRKALQMQQN